HRQRLEEARRGDLGDRSAIRGSRLGTTLLQLRAQFRLQGIEVVGNNHVSRREREERTGPPRPLARTNLCGLAYQVGAICPEPRLRPGTAPSEMSIGPRVK